MAAVDVLLPTSPQEAVQAFGDGKGVTIVAGGTIVMPEINYRRLEPARVLMLARAGLAGITTSGSTVTVGAMTTLAELASLPAPIGPCAAHVGDGEIRGQATVGGNICAGQGHDAPRGDLQGPLLAVGAIVRSVGEGGERREPLEEFLVRRAGRLVLDLTFEQPAAGAWACIDRPHTHEYTALAVSGARTSDGIRLAVTGTASHGVRLPSAEAKADDPEAAGRAALADVTLHDDALASAWYRERVLPVLVRRVLADLKEAA